jgi:hypothetical protein
MDASLVKGPLNSQPRITYKKAARQTSSTKLPMAGATIRLVRSFMDALHRVRQALRPAHSSQGHL